MPEALIGSIRLPVPSHRKTIRPNQRPTVEGVASKRPCSGNI